MRLTILGSGTPEPYARRTSSGYLIEVAGQKLLFDCGGGVVSRLLEAGHMPQDIDTVFFSHLHSDHMLDYARLVHGAWDSALKTLKVYGPEPIKGIHDRLFGTDGALAHDLAARTQNIPSQEIWKARGGSIPRAWPAPEITEIAPGDTVEGDGWTLNSCAVPHAEPWLVCMAFKLASGGKSFVYSGDAGLCEGMKELAKDADLLLHWCYRNDGETLHPELDAKSPTPSELADLAETHGVKRLLLTHIRVQMDAPEAAAKARLALQTGFSGPAEIVEDLQVFDI